MSVIKLSAKGVGAIREGWSVVGTLDSRTFLRESKYPANNVQVHTRWRYIWSISSTHRVLKDLEEFHIKHTLTCLDMVLQSTQVPQRANTRKAVYSKHVQWNLSITNKIVDILMMRILPIPHPSSTVVYHTHIPFCTTNCKMVPTIDTPSSLIEV